MPKLPTMLRKLLPAAFMLCQLTAIAQSKKVTDRVAEKPATPINYELVGSPMPGLLMITIDTPAQKQEKRIKKANYLMSPYSTKMFTQEHFDNGANLLVMMFNPTCGHCEDETEQLIKNIDRFKKTKIILLANLGMKSYLPNFNRTHRVADYSDVITVGVDSTDFIKNTFLYQALPQINIYSADRKLLKTYTGNVSIDTLMQYIQ